MIVTRFAPSPTGYLHIGGARTALFNYLLARNAGGKFLLRIEDTDRERSTQDAVDAILDGLSWLGLDWDEEPLSQASRADRHVEIANALIGKGAAFRCYCTAEEVETLREQAYAEGRAVRSPWRDRDPAEAPEGVPFTVRFRASDQDVTISDAVQGEVSWKSSDFDDLIILRSDGTPTYNLAVIVDDHDMGVTHVVRGDDHLTNAGRQSQIYDALGWDRPVFAHIPLIHGQDGKKLSKRHGALGAEAYRDMGYLPEGLRNYLLRLGWSHGDQEFFSDEEAIAAFTLEGLNKAPARLDLDKLAHINAHHMQQAEDDRLVALVAPFLNSLPDRIDDADLTRLRLKAAMPVLKTRAKTLVELAEQSYFLLRTRPFPVEGKASKPLRQDGAIERLERLNEKLADISDWAEASLGDALAAFAEAEGVGFGKIGPALRAALTGGAPSPDLSQVLAFLGREEALERIKDRLTDAG